MPSMSGWGLWYHAYTAELWGFSAVDVGRGFATMDFEVLGASTEFLCPRCRALCDDLIKALRLLARDKGFLCPRCRAGLCNSSRAERDTTPQGLRFYALNVGWGFATDVAQPLPTAGQFVFLCP